MISDEGKFQGGANEPYLIFCRDRATTELDDYVIKFYGFRNMSLEASMREILASFLAIELDLKTPHPVIIDISEQFIQSTVGKYVYTAASKSIGKNFGTKYIKNGAEFKLLSPNIIQTHINSLVDILIFDLFIENCDRTISKPNMFIANNEINVIDHEKAFSFIFDLPMLRNIEPWKFTQYQIETLRGHILFNFIKNSDINDSIFERISHISDDFWKKASSLIPEEWMGPQFDDIKDYLNLKIKNIFSFKNNILEIIN